MKKRGWLTPVVAAMLLAGCTTEHEVSTREELYRLNTSHVDDRPFLVEGKPFSGVALERVGDQVVYRVRMHDGRKDGLEEKFHEDGKRQSRRTLSWDDDAKRELVVGDSESWCQSGTRRSLVEHDDKGARQLEKDWDCDSGKLVQEVHFDDEDRKDGEARRWTADGQLIEQASWKAGKLHGEHKVWAVDGTLVEHSRYQDGKRQGMQETWYADGKPASRGEFVDDRPAGRHESWNEDGQPESAGSYDASGNKTGAWQEGSLTLHYGPGGFVPQALLDAYANALLRGDAQKVEFYLGEGGIKLTDALPTDYRGRLSVRRYNFPVSDWSYAVVAAHAGLLPLLLEKGGDINQADSNGMTRLLHCVERFSARQNGVNDRCLPAEIRSLLDKGANATVTNRKGRNALHYLIDVASYADSGLWAEQAAEARKARADEVAVLAGAGADVNAADVDGWTPLVLALRSRRVDLVKALLAAGAKADGPGPRDTRAVHWLVLASGGGEYSINGQFVAEVLPLLVAAGADANAPMQWDGSPVTLRDLAVRHGLIDLVRVIEQSGKQH